MIGPMHAEPKLKARVDWGYYSTPQKHLLDRRMPVPRGEVVGGSSSINGMVYVRGNPRQLRLLGRRGQHRLGRRLRQRRLPADGRLRGRCQRLPDAGGPIKITRNKMPQEGTLQFIQATSDAVGVKILDDYNAESQEGVARMQQNAANGLRYSASRGYIHDLEVPTLQLQSEVLVTKVVILSAGFVGSARLLMLSGIGHAQHLTDRGIVTVADLPVGDNLHDHMFHTLTFHATSSKMKGNAFFFGKGVLAELVRPGKTFMPTPSSSRWPSCGPRRRPTYRSSSCTCCRGPTSRPTRTRRSGTTWTARTSLTLLATLIYPKSRDPAAPVFGPFGRSAHRLPVPRRP